MGSRDGGRFLALQRHEVATDDHAAAPAESRLGKDRADLQVHQAPHHQPVAAARAGDLDVQAERERDGLRLRHAEKPRPSQVSSSGA